METGYDVFPRPAGEATLPASPEKLGEDSRRQRFAIVWIVLGLVVFLALLGGAIWFLAASSNTQTEKIRDIFIIFMALEFLVVGLALIVLIVQLATLINLLQNEVKPILESTNETANTLRGTAIFLSNNLAEPVIKMNEYVIALRRFMELIGLGRRR
ncbi:MAG TPA: hypothetical protein VJ436_04235 [Anaerolineales bacterium]|nr:hypothetical protein [Anaerolineales bacterium]